MSRRWNGEKTRQARSALGLTQAEIAEALGVSRTTVVTWEQGENPQLRHAAALADLLGLSLDELFVHDPDAATENGGAAAQHDESPAHANAPAAVVSGVAQGEDQ